IGQQNLVAFFDKREKSGGHRLLRTDGHNDIGRTNAQVRILGRDKFPKLRQAGVRRVSVLFIERNACGFLANEFGRRQIGFAKPEIYRIRQGTFNELTDQRRFQALQTLRQNEFSGLCLFHCSSSASFLPLPPFSRSSPISSRIEPESTLYSPSAAVIGSPVKMPPSSSSPPIVF